MISKQIAVAIWVNLKETNQRLQIKDFTFQRLSQFSSKCEKAKKHRIFIYEHFSNATVQLKKEVVLRRSFTVSAAKQNSIFKLQKHSCQIPFCKIVCLLLYLMSVYLYFLGAFDTT